MPTPISPYSVASPEELERNIPKLMASGAVDQLIMPVLFGSSDKKLLVVGHLEAGKLKLPDTFLHARPNCKLQDITDQVHQLAHFAFGGSGSSLSPRFTGIIRHKAEQRVVIAPVLVRLDERSSDQRLSPTDKWLECTPNNPDQVWMDRSAIYEILDGPNSDLLTSNTAFIIRCAAGPILGIE